MNAVVSRIHHTTLFYLTTALLWSSLYIYMPILPVHAENLGATMGLVGTIVGAYGFSQLVLRVPMGMWSDRIGTRKPFILVGIVAAGVAGLGLAQSSDPNWLVIWRGVAGIGAASWVAFTVLFSSYFPPEKATRAMANLVFITGISQTLCTYAGGMIAEIWGWHAPFYVAILLAFLALLTALILHEKPLTVRRKMTLRDLYRIGTTPQLLIVSVITLLSMWNFTAAGGGFTLVYGGRLGASRSELGMLSTVMQLAHMMAAYASDSVASRFGYCRTVATGLLIQSLACFMVPMVSSLPMLALSQSLSGFGRAFVYSMLMGLSIRAVPPSDRATAMGVFQAIYALGMFAGPATTGVLGDALGFFSVFYIAGAATVLGLFLTLARVPAK